MKLLSELFIFQLRILLLFDERLTPPRAARREPGAVVLPHVIHLKGLKSGPDVALLVGQLFETQNFRRIFRRGFH